MHQERSATLVEILGCPSTVEGKVAPDGKPFVDPNGNCYTCPPFSIRTASAVTSNNACDVAIKWQTPDYPEPGLFRLEGAADVMVEILNDAEGVTDYLFLQAQAAEIPTSDIQGFVDEAWNKIAERPAESEHLNSAVFLRLLGAADHYAELPPDSADRRLVDDFAAYVQDRRTFVAQDALDMYDAWKAGDDYWDAQSAPNIGFLFDFGEIPPDFLGEAQASFDGLLAGVGAPALGALGAGASVAIISANMPTLGAA